ncbi:MAG: MFS transporter [Denitrovibrio sp.]|nr:MAG: MFS transporter [Denitrovibrio sp.]
MLRLSILSISLLTIMAGAAVAPGLAAISNYFPQADQTLIKLVLTLPAIVIIPVSFAMGRLSRLISKKTLLIIGLLLYAVGGVGGGLVDSIEMLLACRALLGVSVGIIMPLSTGLIADLCKPEERTKLMGLASSFSFLGGIIATLAAGFLAVYGWRYTFIVYASSLVVLCLTIFNLPSIPKDVAEKTKSKLPKEVYTYAAGGFGLMVIFYIIPTNIAMHIQSNGFGNASSAGFAIAIATTGGFISGLSFKHIYKLTKQYHIPIVVFISGTGILLLNQATSMTLIMIGSGFIGAGNGLIMPAIFVGVSRAVGQGSSVRAMGVVTSFLFLGQFMSPILMDGIGVIFGNTSFINLSRIAYIIVYAFAILLTIKVFIYKPPKQSE